MKNDSSSEIVIQGIPGSPGICIGQAYIVGREGVDVIEKYAISNDTLVNETNRFRKAVTKSQNELREIIESLTKDISSQANILESHMALFKDKMLYESTIQMIEDEMINPEWALKRVSSGIVRMFKKIDDPYLKARTEDIIQVSDRIMGNLVGIENFKISDIEKRVILIAHDLTPSDTSQIQLEKIMGFVTERGGRASHTSIIARTLEIPSVLGIDDIITRVMNDEVIIIDGFDGKVIIQPSDETIIKYQKKQLEYENYRANVNRAGREPAVTKDGFSMTLMGNMELSEEVVAVRDHGGQGIGLFRTEFQYMNRAAFPTENELYEKYKEIAELIYPEYLVIRTLDINGDKALSYAIEKNEENPALGLRAIRFCLSRPDVFITQVKAILRASVDKNIKIMFPMISSVEEVLEAKKIMRQSILELEREGKEYNSDIEVGIMIEVPSAVILAETLASEVDFFSIGTNDLTQYMLAIDRGNRKVAHLYNSLHPAVIKMIKHIVDVGEKTGTKVCMCGEMAGDSVNVPILLGLGLKELSMTPQSIPQVKDMIRRLSKKESEDLSQKILEQTSISEINKILDEFHKNRD